MGRLQPVHGIAGTEFARLNNDGDQERYCGQEKNRAAENCMETGSHRRRCYRTGRAGSNPQPGRTGRSVLNVGKTPHDSRQDGGTALSSPERLAVLVAEGEGLVAAVNLAGQDGVLVVANLGLDANDHDLISLGEIEPIIAEKLA